MEADEQVVDVAINMNISRGDKKEQDIDFTQVEDNFVFDEQGNKVRFGDVYKDHKCIIIFARNFLCYMCKEYVDDLAHIPAQYLRESNIRLVVIGCAPHKFIRPFRKATGYRYIMLTDPERAIFKKLGLYEKPHTENNKAYCTKHIKSNFLMGVLKSTWRGMEFREMQGDIHQQGGAFIVGPGNVVQHVHRDNAPADHAPINDLLCLAGVPQINFDNDRRVMQL